MFNKTYIDNSYKGPSKIDVTEKRAPTDESVKLLKDFEEKAMSNIISSGRVEDNILNFKWYIYPDRVSWDDICKCVFTVNGKEYDFQFVLPRERFTTSSEIVSRIREKMLEKLTGIFMIDLFKTCEHTLINKYKIQQ